MQERSNFYTELISLVWVLQTSSKALFRLDIWLAVFVRPIYSVHSLESFLKEKRCALSSWYGQNAWTKERTEQISSDYRMIWVSNNEDDLLLLNAADYLVNNPTRRRPFVPPRSEILPGGARGLLSSLSSVLQRFWILFPAKHSRKATGVSWTWQVVYCNGC